MLRYEKSSIEGRRRLFSSVLLSAVLALSPNAPAGTPLEKLPTAFHVPAERRETKEETLNLKDEGEEIDYDRKNDRKPENPYVAPYKF